MAQINLGRVKGDPFTYEDFTPEQLAALKGEDGKDFPRFSGTMEEYEAVASEIEDGAIVTITDDFDEEHLIDVDTLRRVSEVEEAVEELKNNGASNIVYLTQEEYDALPATKESDDVEYRITDAGTPTVASNVGYDGSVSGIDAVNVQGAIDKVSESLVWKYIPVNETLTDGYTYALPNEVSSANEIEIYCGISTVNASKQWQPVIEGWAVGFCYGVSGSEYYAEVALYLANDKSKIILSNQRVIGWNSGVMSLFQIRYR